MLLGFITFPTSKDVENEILGFINLSVFGQFELVKLDVTWDLNH